ncbi:alpha/beta hydrolase [Bacillota bacterium LX-D]|nr:alpha/beta hydrolase [Bacillota bacterium LX-D]
MLTPKYKSSTLITIDNAVIEYVDLLGDGTPIIFIPGAEDGLYTVGKIPFPYLLAKMFKTYANNHRLIIMSRREPIPQGFTVRDLAKDYVWAMDELKIDRAHIETNSAGGPIGQWIAIDYPKRIRSLVLGETMAHVDEKFNKILLQWVDWCKNWKWYKLYVDSIVKTFTPKYYGKYKWAFPLIHLIPKPKNPERMIRILQGLFDLDNRPYLDKINCLTLVIGGDADVLTRPELQKAMADLIPGAKQVLIPGVGHGENLEAKKEHEMNVLSFYDEVDKSIL